MPWCWRRVRCSRIGSGTGSCARFFRDVRKQRQEIDARAAEAFGGMRVVRAFGRQRREAARFVGSNHFMTRQELFAWWWSRIVEVVWDLFLPAASGAMLLFGGMAVLDGRLSLGDLMMFLVYLAMLLEPLAVLATSATQLQNNLSGFDRVLDLLAEPREMVSNPGAIAVPKRSVLGRISLENVGFTYPTGDSAVLSNVNLEVEAGSVIALVGRSGAGKTTLCNLIARFYDPTAGTVRLDGHRPSRDRCRELPPPSGDRRAGCLPVRWNRGREHRLRRKEREVRRGRERRQSGSCR